MTDFFPHIFKAFLNWCQENNVSTVVVFKGITDEAKEQGLQDYVDKDYLTLIINASNKELFTINETSVEFEVRINGKTRSIVMPFLKVVALKMFNTTTGEVVFTLPITPNPTIMKEPSKQKKEKIKANHLKLVKKDS